MKDFSFYDYIEDRLQHWAKWYLLHAHQGLGFHSRSIEARLREEGNIAHQNTPGTRYPKFNYEADEIERLVCELGRQNARIARALREQYIGTGTVKAKALRINVSCSQFKVHVDMAKQWLTGWLTAREKIRTNN